MAELVVKIKMDDSSLNSFWKDLIKEAKKAGFTVERREIVEIDEGLMLSEREHAMIYSNTIAGIQTSILANQVNEFFQK